MSNRQFTVIKIIVAVVLGVTAAWAATSGNIPILITAMVVFVAMLVLLRRRVKEITVDERVYTVAYRATRLAYMVFVVIAVIVGITLTHLAEDAADPRFYIGLTLDYSACALVVFYWLGYTYYNRKLGGKE
jgi:uncharacterized membrane protein